MTMLLRIRKIFEYIENTPMSAAQWIVGGSGIVFMRLILENISSPVPTNLVTSDFATISHAILFFFGLILNLILVIHLFTKEKIVKISKLLLFGLVAIWLAPLIDLAVRGSESSMAYIFAKPNELPLLFLSYFGPLTNGITLGIRVEVVIVLLFVACYLWVKTSSIIKVILGTVSSYAVIFAWLALPSLIKFIVDVFNPLIRNLSFNEFFYTSVRHSIITEKFFNPSVTVNFIKASEVFPLIAINQIMFLISVVLLVCWMFFYDSRKLLAVVSNSRFLRVVHYFAFITIGLYLPGLHTQVPHNWVYFMSLLMLFLSFYFAWLFAVGTNDLEDVEVDKISNTHRPLVSGHLSVGELKNLNVFMLALSLIGAALVGEYTFFFVSVFTFAYYIYSMPPLKLKRVPVVATFLIAIATLSATLSGYFFESIAGSLENFDLRYIFLILIGITIGALIKDIKDSEGDAANGVKTFANMFEDDFTKKLFVAVMSFVFFFLPAVILDNQRLIYPAIIFIPASAFLIARKYNERWLFVLHYLFLVSVILIQSGKL